MTSAPMMDPSVARSGNADAELRARQREIEQNRRTINAGTQKTKDEKLRESCEGFEAMFIQKMWEGMRASLPKDGMMQSRDEKHWQGMYDQELGKSMAKSGGIGLADMMMSQLSRNLQDASDVAAGSSSRRRPMDIAPAPLLVEQQPAPKNPAPVVASAVSSAPNASASAAQGTATESQNSDATKPGMDMYSSAAAVAPSPDDPATDAAGTTGSVAATAPIPPVNTPPEVQSALTSLATMTTQAEVARGIGQQTVNHINGQQPTFPAQPGSATQTGVQAQAGASSRIPSTTTAYPQGVNPASVNTPPPDLPTLTPRQPVYTAPRTAAKAPSEDVHQMTRTQRQTARTSQTPRAPRSPNGLDMQHGAEFATNTVSRSAAPLTGQNMPVSPVGDIATELLKNQLGEPTVRTKL